MLEVFLLVTARSKEISREWSGNRLWAMSKDSIGGEDTQE